jgi:hypothetical protein
VGLIKRPAPEGSIGSVCPALDAGTCSKEQPPKESFCREISIEVMSVLLTREGMEYSNEFRGAR